MCLSEVMALPVQKLHAAIRLSGAIWVVVVFGVLISFLMKR